MFYLFSIFMGFVAHAGVGAEEMACVARFEESGQLFSTYNANGIYRSCMGGGNDTDSLRTINRAFVSKWVLGCGLSVSEGKSVRVAGRNYWTCKKHPLWIETSSYNFRNYKIWRAADGVHVGLNVRLNISSPVSTDERAKYMLEKTRQCAPIVANLWEQYGVKLDLKFDSVQEPSFKVKPDYVVQLTDQIEGKRRSNAARLYFRVGSYHTSGACLNTCLKRFGLEVCDPLCEPGRQRDYCILIGHESGHWLGLADEYVDEDCPDRKTHSMETGTISLMSASPESWDGLELFPRHLKSVVGPLCNQ